MKKYIIINGPNLNLLGKRETSIYGSQDFESFINELSEQFPHVHLAYFQTNHEGEIIDKLHEVGFSYDGIVINAGAYTHTSIAIADAIRAIETPCIEVHISNIYEREQFRHLSYLEEPCIHQIIGEGLPGYAMALDHFLSKV